MSTPSRWMSVPPSLHLLPLFLSLLFGVQGATLREPHLSGSDPGAYVPGSQLHPPPSAEMLRALRYIQSLSQRTGNDRQPITADRQTEDMDSVRSMLQLAAPARGSTGTTRGLEDREDENDNTQQWLQAVLTTLQQTEEQTAPQKTSQKIPTKISSPSYPRYNIQPLPKQQLDMDPSSAENHERTSWSNPGSQRQHRQYSLMFDDEDERPLKRTNENAEEQYTPQKLATLQSVFEELSGISTSKSNNKREQAAATTDDEDVDDEDDVDDLYRQRKMALEDIMGTDEWEPLEENVETEEEQRDRHGFNSNFEDDDDDDEVKRSNQPDLFQTKKEEDPEDIAKLVDYYLLKVLEKKEQEQQRRDEANDGEQEEQETYREIEKKDADEEDGEDEDDRDEEEREINPMRPTLPQSLSQLIKVSQKLQIPPQDVLDLLQNERSNFRVPPRTLAQARTSPRTYASIHDARKTYAASPHQRPLETSERNNVAQDIMKILELVSAAHLHDKLPQKMSPPKPLRYYERERDLPGYGFPESSRDDYDDTAGEDDELASFLASEMLAQGQRRQRAAYGKLERAVQDYLDKNSAEKRGTEHNSANTSSDEDKMLKLLQYLEPESDGTGETDSEGKPVPEM